MELYYIVLSLPLCIVLFSHNMLYIPVLLLLNKFSFKPRDDLFILIVYATAQCLNKIYLISSESST